MKDVSIEELLAEIIANPTPSPVPCTPAVDAATYLVTDDEPPEGSVRRFRRPRD